MWCVGVSCSTWSQTCGSWNLPRFLLSEGSLILMYLASLMFLVKPWDSLSTMENQSGLIGCHVGGGMKMNRWWCFKMFLESVPKCPARFTYVFFCAVDMWTFVFVNKPTFSSLLSLSLVPWEVAWWCLFPWNVPVCPVCCKYSWTSLPTPVCRVPPQGCFYVCCGWW